MALLQISEPGLSAAPHQRRLAVGIDLGTTNSLVATVRSGQAETLADEQGRHLLPSVVHYQADAQRGRLGGPRQRRAGSGQYHQLRQAHDGPLAGRYSAPLPASAVSIPGQ